MTSTIVSPNPNQLITRVLVVDDEPSITDLLSLVLRYEHMEVEIAHNARDALAKIGSFRPHLVVLDIMLPDLSGFDILQRMRRDALAPTTPVLFLTARDTIPDKIRGFTLGADDYMTKPFSVEELIMRIQAILRRAFGEPEPAKIGFADLELDDTLHEVRRSGELIDLTPTEFKLLRYLLQNAGKVLTKSQILDRVWNYDFGGDANVVEIYISYLRKKIDHLKSPLIHTVRGVGYSLRLPRETS